MGTLGYVSQGYKAIKATGGGSRDGFLKATRLSRLQEGDAGICFSRLQGYQGYRRGTQGKVSQGYNAIKATGGWMQGWVSQGYKAIKQEGNAGMDLSRLSRLQEDGAGLGYSRLQGFQGYRRGMQG